MTTETPPEGTNVHLIYLTFWDKTAIIAGACGFLLLVTICMVCFLCPDCLCYGVCCDRDEDDGEKKKPLKKTKSGSQRSTSSKGSYGSTESDYFYSAPPPSGVKGSGSNLYKPMEKVKEDYHNGSDWSSDAGSAKEVIKLDKMRKSSLIIHHGLQNGEVNDVNGTLLETGRIEFALTYFLSDEKLCIHVKEVRDVKMTSGNSLVSPYVRIRIYRTPKQFFTFRENVDKHSVMHNLEKEFKTKMHRPADVLAYKETFEVSVDLDSVKTMTIRFLLSDMDKLTRHVTLGETSLALKKTQIWSTGEVAFSEVFRSPVGEDVGTLIIGLIYLPTSEKLYLSVEAVKGLVVMDKVKGSTDACVKAFLMHEGKQLKRVKTTVRASDLNPIFNESFSFDVPVAEVDKVYFSLVVCHYDAEKKSSKVIGRVYIGMHFDISAREHWTAMVNNPRKKVVTSYKITN